MNHYVVKYVENDQLQQMLLDQYQSRYNVLNPQASYRHN